MPTGIEDDEYFLPLEDQRVFGAGIRRKRVPFVRSSEHELNTTTPALAPSTPSGTSIANKYLSIVLPKSNAGATTQGSLVTNVSRLSPRTTHSAPPLTDSTSTSTHSNSRCEVCNLPLPSAQRSLDSGSSGNRPHEASLAHQACLAHSHPPSHLDRNRAGLRYLSTYGWDPDSRLGLGVSGREGIREPLKGRVKNDTAGLGVGLDPDGDRKPPPPPPPKKVPTLNAKQARKAAAESKRKHERLRNMFFQSDEVLKYLGEDI